jgi:Autographiviridae endonuclease VII
VIEASRICKRCLVEKDIEEYRFNGKRRRLLCNECGNKQGLAHYHDAGQHERILTRRKELKKLRSKRWHKNNTLKQRHGISLEIYEQMHKEQDGLCAICHKPERIKKIDQPLAVDHCHVTKKIRGLLCYRCNTSLGLLEEDVNAVRRMMEYIEKHNEFAF